MHKTKICSKCKEPKIMEMFGKKKGSRDGYRSQCKKCQSIYTAKRYADIKGRPVQKYNVQGHADKIEIPFKLKPLLLSWQPQPGDQFDAYLLRTKCILNPFVCERNGERDVIAMSLGDRYRLDKAEYIFVRPN